MPKLQGYSALLYQEHDALITKLVTGGTASQSSSIPDLTETLVKSWLIQETGGNDTR